MFKMKGTKRSLLMSALALLLCVSMLIGSTFAWFTDSVTSAGNIIKSGTLKISMKWADGTKAVPAADSADWTDASEGPIFKYDLWEPGYTEARHIAVKNEGTLALKYRLSIVPNGEVSKLADVIDVYYITDAKQIPARADLSTYTPVGTLADLIDNDLGLDKIPSGSLVAGASFTATLVLKMQESAGNEYQDLSIGTDFSVKLIATQEMEEIDSYGKDYDKLAPWTGNIAQPAQDENGVWQIGSAEELAWFASYVNGYVPVTFAAAAKQHNAVLTADINLNNIPWTPIGRTLTEADKAAGAHSFDFAFSGSSGNHAVFDGQGHTIYNLNVNETANAGLFGNAVYAAIKNVNVTGAKIISNHFAGTILAQGYAKVEGCNVKDATVICTPELLGDEWDNGDKAGGVVGKISECNNNGVYGVINCSATDVTVTAYRDAGGILGYAGNYADVKNNSVINVTMVQDASHDYKNYDNAAKYNINAVVGDSTRSTGVLVEGNVESNVKIEVPQDIVTVATFADLKQMLTQLTDSGSGNNAINITADIKPNEGEVWEPVTVQGYTGAGVITINGNGHTIYDLNAPLLAGGFAGKSGIVINDLTLANANIVDSTNSQGIGAFIGCVDSMQKIELNNCHLKDSKIESTGGARVGGLIGWTAGYSNPNDGPVDTYVTITNCTVVNCEITAAGSVGGIIGHAGASKATYQTISGCKVEKCVLTSNDDSYRVGAIAGTANNGQLTISNCTSTENTMVQNNNGTIIDRPAGQSDLYGRFVPSGTGVLIIDGVSIN